MQPQEKTSHVVSCVFVNDWLNPSKKTVYYHDIEFANGDKGTCGTYEKYPDKLSELSEVTYTMAEGKIKILSYKIYDKDKPAEKEDTGKKKPKYDNTKSKGSYTGKAVTKESMLGYSYSYAKDLLIAGKTSADIPELKKMAKAIYDHVGELLNENKEQ